MAVCTTCLQPGIRAGEHDCPGLGDIQLTRQLGHGLRVDTAPARARMAVALLANGAYGLTMHSDDHINIADQVLYQVVGYDPESAALVLELVEDWRPKSEEQDDPPVQCWHTEPGSPCDWNICRQPERLAAGDRGTDPAHAAPSEEQSDA